MIHSNKATCPEDSNLNAGKQSEISGAQKIKVITVTKGCHTAHMGLNRRLKGPNTGYNPTQGLASLFSKTGTGSRNPKPQLRSSTPQNTQPATPRRSYADVVRSRMNDSGQYGNGAGGGLRGNGSGGFRGQSQGESFARPGYQRPYQRYGNTGLMVVGEVADDMILVVGASVEISDNQNSGQAMESSGNVLHSPESWG
jgi:hypothetical protein